MNAHHSLVYYLAYSNIQHIGLQKFHNKKIGSGDGEGLTGGGGDKQPQPQKQPQKQTWHVKIAYSVCEVEDDEAICWTEELLIEAAFVMEVELTSPATMVPSVRHPWTMLGAVLGRCLHL